MEIISYGPIKRFIQKHPESKSGLNTWYKTAKNATWKNLSEVKNTYPHADLYGSCTIFNISGNKYRLVVKIDYQGQIILIKHIMTHAEYDKDKWKKDC
jgi:mRNA interferase HigB